MDANNLISSVFIFVIVASIGQSVFVDPGVPYKDGPLTTGEMTVQVTTTKTPRHAKVYFPLAVGDYSVIYFLGGMGTLVPAELYSIVLTKVASHGFFVFGVDGEWPLDDAVDDVTEENYGRDIEPYYQELAFLQKYMVNRTVGTPDWTDMGVMCHSAGCDIALHMIESNKVSFKAGAFMEPFSSLAKEPVNYTIPALMYAAQLAYEFPPCNIHGYGFQQFYKQWKCPRIALEVAGFGHCDFLDPVGWEVCHTSGFCKTTNDSRAVEYRQFVQGVSASFFISTLQGRKDAINYITDQTKLTMPCLVDVPDINC